MNEKFSSGTKNLKQTNKHSKCGTLKNHTCKCSIAAGTEHRSKFAAFLREW